MTLVTLKDERDGSGVEWSGFGAELGPWSWEMVISHVTLASKNRGRRRTRQDRRVEDVSVQQLMKC
jgi:hypothetical protein